MADQIKIEIDVETRKAIGELAKVAKATENVTKEVEKLTLSQRAWKAANSDLGKLTGEWRELGESAGKVAATFVGLGVASVAVMASAERQEAALRRLGSAYDVVSAATNGAFSAQQALTLQGQIQAAGVRVNEQQLGLLARAAREYAQATGNDASEAVEKLTNAIVNNSEDALSELNLSQARATNSTQTLANMTRELEARFRGVAPAARTLNEDLEKLPQVLTYIGNAAAQAAAGGLRSFIDALWGAGSATAMWRDVTNFADDRRNIGRQQQTDSSNASRTSARERAIAALSSRNLTIDASAFGGLQGMSERELTRVTEIAESARFGNAAINQTHVNNEMRTFLEQRGIAQREDDRRAGTTAAPTRPTEEWERQKEQIAKTLSNATGGVSNAALAFERAAKRMELATGQIASEANDLAVSLVGANNALRNRFQTLGNALGLQGLDAAEGAELFGGIADAQEGGGAATRDARARQQRIFARDRTTREQAFGSSLGGRVAAGLGVSTDALATEAKLTQGYADTITGAFGKIGDAISRHVELVASGQETIGQALLAGTFEVTKALAMEALPRALMETAAGFAALANPITAATAPLHFTAAGVYGAVAAGAGLVAGVTGALGGASPAGAAGAGGARATGAARAASGATPRATQEQAAPVAIYLSSLVPPGPRELQGLVNATAQTGRYGIDRRGMVPRQVRA